MVNESISNGKNADNSEVRLDGDDNLSAALNNLESGYPMYNIKVDRGFYTVYELKRKYSSEDKRIILDSDFQRESVWKPIQQAELVESILMGLPLPIFYFNQDKKGRLIVVDGRQRLTALFEYMSNKWALKGLRILGELDGKKFEDLTPVVQAQIEDYQIQAHVIQPPTSDRIKFDIFDRVNRAGTQLNKQEIRNALYQGNATNLLNRIVKSKEFNDATDNAFKKNARMKDKYIVLRFLAFELYFGNKLFNKNQGYLYKNDIDELLGITMEHINDLSIDMVNKMYRDSVRALKLSYEILGENAYRMIRINGTKSPINMNLFEVITHLMCRTPEDALVIKNKYIEKIDEMKSSYEFQDSIGNHRDNRLKVEARYSIVDKIWEELND